MPLVLFCHFCLILICTDLELSDLFESNDEVEISVQKCLKIVTAIIKAIVMTLGYDCGFQRVKAKDGQHHFRAKSKAPKDLSLLVDSLGFMINAMLKMSSTVMSKNKDLLE